MQDKKACLFIYLFIYWKNIFIQEKKTFFVFWDFLPASVLLKLSLGSPAGKLFLFSCKAIIIKRGEVAP